MDEYSWGSRSREAVHMKIRYAFLAKNASFTDGGGLIVVDADFDLLTVPKLPHCAEPLHVVMRLDFDPTEVAAEHLIGVRLRPHDGEAPEVVPYPVAPPRSEAAKKTASVRLISTTEETTFTQAGRYYCDVVVDGEVQTSLRFEIRVQAEPPAGGWTVLE